MLTDGGFLRISIYDPEPNIQEDHSGNYIDGQMDNESSPKGFYIVFDKKNYGIDDVSTRSVLVPENPLSGSSEKVTFGFTARSAHGFDVRSPGIVLFHLSHYVGNAKDYRTSHPDITDAFPGFVTSVSSFIVTGGTWKLWGGKNYKPPLIAVDGVTEFGPGLYPRIGSSEVSSIERISSKKESK